MADIGSVRLEQNKVIEFIEPPVETDTLFPNPNGLFGGKAINLDALRQLSGQSLTSAKQLSRPQVIALARLAAFLESLEIAPYRPLDGKIVITAFFEASTRTRTSFESATLRLDGKIISIPDGSITGVKKGESLADIGEMFNAYGDLVIMRHTETDSIEQITENLRIPIINAGNGSGEHPTQALADWYALLKWRPSLMGPTPEASKKLHLGILGTPGNMRAVKSFLLLALMFRDHISRVTVVSEMADPFGSELRDDILAANIDYEVKTSLTDVLGDLDVIYMNSIAFLGDSYRSLNKACSLDERSQLKPEAVILHPLARGSELSTTLDATKHNLYFSQAHGAVFIRQALLTAVFDRLDRLPRVRPLARS